MILGVSYQRIWEFANKQKFTFKEVKVILNPSDLSKYDVDTLIVLDDRYNELGELFSGYIFFSHIKAIVPITKESAESIEQLYNMFPEINMR